MLENEINKDIATTFLKGLSVIEAFDHENPSMTLTDVAKKVNITRSSARRFLLSLESLGYATQNDKLFSLTPKIINLGYSYFASLSWTDLAYKYVKMVVKECKLSCAVSILDGENITCIMRVNSSKILKGGIHVGGKLPAPYTATGRLFMAEMNDKELREYLTKTPLQRYTSKTITDPNKLFEKIKSERNQPYQVIEEELEDGLLAIAAPIYDSHHKILGCMTIGTYMSEENAKYLKEYVLPMLIDAANNATEAIVLLKH